MRLIVKKKQCCFVFTTLFLNTHFSWITRNSIWWSNWTNQNVFNDILFNSWLWKSGGFCCGWLLLIWERKKSIVVPSTRTKNKAEVIALYIVCFLSSKIIQFNITPIDSINKTLLLCWACTALQFVKYISKMKYWFSLSNSVGLVFVYRAILDRFQTPACVLSVVLRFHICTFCFDKVIIVAETICLLCFSRIKVIRN